jgi:hypothetical protein
VTAAEAGDAQAADPARPEHPAARAVDEIGSGVPGRVPGARARAAPVFVAPVFVAPVFVAPVFVAPVFVAAVWLAMVAAGVGFVARYAPAIPFLDDLALASKYDARQAITAHWLWEPYNVHRIPIANFVNAELVRHTSDVRTGMYLNVALLGAVSLAMILAARRIRGRTIWADAFFPLLWLHWGNAENFLMAFQLSVLLPAAIVATALMLIATSEAGLTPARAAWIGACVVLLPFNGGHGLTQAPPWIAWLCVMGFVLCRATDARARRAGRWMCASALATFALLVLYLVHLEIPKGPTTTSSPIAILRGVVNFLSLCIGPGTIALAPFSMMLVIGACAITGWMLLRIARTDRRESARAGGILACMGGVLTMAVCVGWGRTSEWKFVGIAPRYVSLPANLACCVYFAWCLYGSPLVGRVVQYAACALMAALIAIHVDIGREYGEVRRDAAVDFTRDVEAGLAISTLAIKDAEALSYSPHDLEPLLRYLDSARRPPFDRRPAEVPFAFDAVHPYRIMPARPIAASSPAPILPIMHLGDGVLIVRPPGELRFAVPSGARTLQVGFGIHLEAYQDGADAAVRFSVEIAPIDAPPLELFERTLEPACNGPDRGVQHATIALPPYSGGEIVLRTMHVPGHDAERSWSFWSGVAFE